MTLHRSVGFFIYLGMLYIPIVGNVHLLALVKEEINVANWQL